MSGAVPSSLAVRRACVLAMMSLIGRLRKLLSRLFSGRRNSAPDPDGEAVTNATGSPAPSLTVSYARGEAVALASDKGPLDRPGEIVFVVESNFDTGDHFIRYVCPDVVEQLDGSEVELSDGGFPANTIANATDFEHDASASQATDRAHTATMKAEPELPPMRHADVGLADDVTAANVDSEPGLAGGTVTGEAAVSDIRHDETSIATTAIDDDGFQATARLVTPTSDGPEASASEAAREAPRDAAGSADEVTADLIKPGVNYIAVEESSLAVDPTTDVGDSPEDAPEVEEISGPAGENDSAEEQNDRYPAVEEPEVRPCPDVNAFDAESLGPRATAEDAGSADEATSTFRRRPGEYRPRLSRVRMRRTPAAMSPSETEIQNLDAALQLLIGPGDWGVELWALLRTPNGVQDDEVAVDLGGEEFLLGQLDEQLLEPIALPDAAAAFGEPLLFAAVGIPVTWTRTSRDLHVLSPDPRVAGFVSNPRVRIGQESVVICRERLSEVALAQIVATGSPEPIRIEGPNVPDGWICWRGVRPLRPSLPVGGPSILDALDPLPAVAIEFSGGIKLAPATWLEGYPPTIQLLGLLSEGDPVLIDGREGAQDSNGGWTAARWDAPGQHRVEHGGVMANYAVEAGVSDWGWWPAWSDAVPLAGALSGPGEGRFFQTNSAGVLIGARPGEICMFTALEGSVSVASPHFEPVWMLSSSVGIRRTGPALIGSKATPGTPIGSPDAVLRWSRAICSSRRAGADGGPERALWIRYLATARSLRKRYR